MRNDTKPGCNDFLHSGFSFALHLHPKSNSMKYFWLLIVPVLLNGCIEANSSFTRVAPGTWRGVLELEKFSMPAQKKDDVSILYEQFKPGELPFNFEVVYTENERFYIEIINGAQRIRLDSIQYGRDRTLARDTMNVWFPEYQSFIHAEIRGGVMQGYWRLTTKEDYQIPFYAHAGRDYRFTNLRKTPDRDISGDWATIFDIDKPEAEREKAVAEFKQDGNHLLGTFRTETGDYGYLEGTVQGRKFWLSGFDGAHALLFSGSVRGDTIQGEVRFGHKSRSLWSAWKDPAFDLRAADSITQTIKGAGISFSVTTPEGRQLAFPSPEFAGKIKIFTISGTWCPNCRDEQVFLTEFMKENPELASNISAVCFSFERNKDAAQANNHLMRYKKKLGIPYEIVYAGQASREEAARMFPVLDQVNAFPTMIVLDKNDQIRLVHTGFDGPATSRYASFKNQFKALVTSLQ
jgi:thiol-disulfide isomerase/thioredoxin